MAIQNRHPLQLPLQYAPHLHKDVWYTMVQRAFSALLGALALLVPLIVSSVWLALQHDAHLLEHVPFWNDELYHWHQSATFAEAGFQGGYYSLNENIPLADFSHFYSWGAWAYVVYGALGRVFGWGLPSMILVNLLLFWLAGAVFLAAVRLSRLQIALLGVVLGTFIPLLIYLPSSMLQLPNLAIALVIAAGFVQLLRSEVSGRFLWLFGGFLLLMGLLRPTWSLFLLPMFVLAAPRRNWRTVSFAAVKAVPLVLLAAAGFYLSAAPFPHFRTRLFLGTTTLLDKLQSVLAYLEQSLIWIIEETNPIINGQRVQIVLLLVLLIGWGAWQWWRSRNPSPTEEDDPAWRWEWALHIFNLAGFYAATILFHETLGGHDYRVMAPHLLLSLLLLLALRRYRLLGALLLVTALLLPAAYEEFRWKEFNVNGIAAQQYEQWQPVLAEVLQYDPDADNPWCNTLSTAAFYVTPFQGDAGLLLAVDAGIGLSWHFDWDETGRFSTPEDFRSRYLMLTDEEYAQWGAGLNLRELVRVQNGALYENLDAACGT